MDRYSLTSFQKELLICIAPIIRKTQSLEFLAMWHNDSGQSRPLFAVGMEIEDQSWRDTWMKMSQSDFKQLQQKGYIHWLEKDAYGLDVPAILDAVDTHFGAISKENPVPHIFISYAREDRAITQRLFNLLSLAYDHVWYDKRLRTGQEWEHELLNRISECTEFIFLLSKDSVISEWCKKEFDEATRLSRRILVYRLDETDIPTWLHHLQVAEMREINASTIAEVFATLIRLYSGS